MTTGNELITNNWKQAECNFYAGGSALALQVAVTSLVTLQFWGTIAAAAGGLAFEYAAGLAGCTNNPDSPSAGDPAGIDGCYKVINGTGSMFSAVDNNRIGGNMGFNITEILSFAPNPATGSYDDGTLWRVRYADGTEGGFIEGGDRGRFAYLRPDGDAVCDGDSHPAGPLPPDAIGEPTVVEDEGCNWTFTPYDSFIDGSGAVQVYWVIEADNDACGGPFAYWSGPSGPQPVNPNPPDESPDPILPPDIKDDEGTDSIQKELKEIKEQLDVIQNCACDDPKPTLLGDWVSIRFVSDGISPNGTAPLRKLFRYRSQSSRDEQQLRDYWAGFTWQAGPVIVQHKGTWWGTPQVWASSAEEGKRVLRFAAGEAGASPDTDGEWIVTGSASPRYGMSGTMRVQQYRGRDWVTQRIGPSGPVEL